MSPRTLFTGEIMFYGGTLFTGGDTTHGGTVFTATPILQAIGAGEREGWLARLTLAD